MAEIAWMNYCNAGRRWRGDSMHKSRWQWFNLKHHKEFWRTLMFSRHGYLIIKDGKYYHKKEGWFHNFFNNAKISECLGDANG